MFRLSQRALILIALLLTGQPLLCLHISPRGPFSCAPPNAWTTEEAAVEVAKTACSYLEGRPLLATSFQCTVSGNSDAHAQNSIAARAAPTLSVI